MRGRTAKPTNMEVPPRMNAVKVDGEEHHGSQPGKYNQPASSPTCTKGIVTTRPDIACSFAILSRIPAVQPGLPPNTYGISRVLLPLKHSASPDRFVMYSDALRGNPDNSLSTGGFATQWGNRLQLHVSIIYRV